MAPSNVPASLNVPMWSSDRTVSRRAGGSQPASVHAKAAGVEHARAAAQPRRAASGCRGRGAASRRPRTRSPGPRRRAARPRRRRGPAAPARVRAPPRSSASSPARGAQTRKRVRPSAVGTAPSGASQGYSIPGDISGHRTRAAPPYTFRVARLALGLLTDAADLAPLAAVHLDRDGGALRPVRPGARERPALATPRAWWAAGRRSPPSRSTRRTADRRPGRRPRGRPGTRRAAGR